MGRRNVSRPKRRSHFQAACSNLSFWTMRKSEPIPFTCPACEAEYKIVTIEACDVQQGKVHCLNCDALFPAGEGRVAFKYFLVGRRRGRKRK